MHTLTVPSSPLINAFEETVLFLCKRLLGYYSKDDTSLSNTLWPLILQRNIIMSLVIYVGSKLMDFAPFLYNTKFKDIH